MNNDKAIDLAKKLKALAERGIGGEKENASHQLKRILNKYGITLKDIEEDKKQERFFKYKKGDDLHGRFVNQVVASVVGNRTSYVASDARYRNYFKIKVTDSEYIEISEKIDFYWKAFNGDLDIFYRAFIQKNHLYMTGGKSRDEEEMTQKEKDELLKMFNMMNGMEEHRMKRKIALKQLR